MPQEFAVANENILDEAMAGVSGLIQSARQAGQGLRYRLMQETQHVAQAHRNAVAEERAKASDELAEQRDAARQAQMERETQARLHRDEVQGARIAVSRIERDGWWDTADEKQVAAMAHRFAVYKGEDETIADLSQVFEREVEKRYGVDLTGATRLDVAAKVSDADLEEVAKLADAPRSAEEIREDIALASAADQLGSGEVNWYDPEEILAIQKLAGLSSEDRQQKVDEMEQANQAFLDLMVEYPEECEAYLEEKGKFGPPHSQLEAHRLRKKAATQTHEPTAEMAVGTSEVDVVETQTTNLVPNVRREELMAVAYEDEKARRSDEVEAEVRVPQGEVNGDDQIETHIEAVDAYKREKEIMAAYPEHAEEIQRGIEVRQAAFPATVTEALNQKAAGSDTPAKRATQTQTHTRQRRFGRS